MVVKSKHYSWGEIGVAWNRSWGLGVWIETGASEHLFLNIAIGPLEAWLMWQR